MNPETFFDKFGLLADTPNGVQKLRELILQLAVQGKLVPQDPNDEPASVLLERIKAEKERLVKGKNIKRAKELPSIEEDELPYVLPKEWTWARLSEITEIIMGNSPPGDTYNEKGEGVPLINGPVEFSEGPFGHTIKSKFTTKPTKFCEEGDLLICVRGSTTGRTNVTGFEACIGRGVAVIRSKVHQPYINYFILSMRQQIYDLGTGSTFPSISQKHLMMFLVSLPPLNEQRRIVAKVDNLMTLCDELEARQQKKQEARLRLNSAALDKLLAAHEPDEFAHHWQRICDNFDLLYGAPETVGELRKAILQLAVQGKLVRQDSNDEPAAALLGKIRAEKERLVKEKKIRKAKAQSLIDEDEMQYELPEGWGWVRLDDVSDIGTGSTPLKSNLDYYEGGSIPWVTSSATSSEYVERVDVYITEKAVTEYRLRLYPVGSLIIALYGQGKTRGQVSELNIEATINQACSAIVFFEPFEGIKQYVKLVLRKKYDELRALAAGGAQPNLNVGKIKETILPFPPLEEQRRIVVKVDQLMALCDELESKLKQSQTDGKKLMEAVVHQLVAA